jgi:hypothetical protein
MASLSPSPETLCALTVPSLTITAMAKRFTCQIALSAGLSTRWPQYIRFIFDHDTQQHFVAATCNNLDNGRDQYGWTLEAVLFTGPIITDVDDSELDILADSGPDKLKVDIALHAVNNKGISADISRLRHLTTQHIRKTMVFLFML